MLEHDHTSTPTSGSQWTLHSLILTSPMDLPARLESVKILTSSRPHSILNTRGGGGQEGEEGEEEGEDEEEKGEEEEEGEGSEPASSVAEEAEAERAPSAPPGAGRLRRESRRDRQRVPVSDSSICSPLSLEAMLRLGGWRLGGSESGRR